MCYTISVDLVTFEIKMLILVLRL